MGCAAESVGSVVELLANQPIALGEFPDFAERTEAQVLEFFVQEWHKKDSENKSDCWYRAKPQVQLLANYLMAECPATERVLQGLVEYMVVFANANEAGQGTAAGLRDVEGIPFEK